MTKLELKAETARKEWRETIDAAYAGGKEVVIRRYGAPIVTIVNHDVYEAQKKRLADLETLLLHHQARAEVEQDPSLLIPQADFNKLLITAGLAIPANSN